LKLWIALECDFLLNLALGEEKALASLDTIRAINGYPLITPSVMRELADQKNNGKDEAFRNVAAKALLCLNSWNILAHDLVDKDRAVAVIVARKMVAKGLAPDFHGARIFAEAAISRCRLILSYRPEVIKVDVAALKMFWIENDFPDCNAVPPHWFVHYFTPQVK
jgi:ribosomal protein S26